MVYFMLDGWFRSGAFAIFGYTLDEEFAHGWVSFFTPALVDFHSHAWWIILFSVICLVAVVGALMLRATRYDILYNSTLPVPGKLRSCLRFGYAIIRFNEGFLVAIAFLFMDPWVCDFRKFNGSEFEYYITGDCNSAVECHTGGYYAIIVVATILLLVLYLNFMLPTRSPVARWSMFAFGIPHLSSGTVFLRVLLAWSAKVLSHWSLCASLYVSGISNMLLFICFALALDSRRLHMPPVVFVVGCLVEVWVLFYSVANAIAYGGACAIVLCIILRE